MSDESNAAALLLKAAVKNMSAKNLLATTANKLALKANPNATPDDVAAAVQVAKDVIADAKVDLKYAKKEFEKTDAGQRKLEIAKWAGYARLSTAYLLDVLGGRAEIVGNKVLVNPSTVQSRKGAEIKLRQNRVVVGTVSHRQIAEKLRTLLREDGFEFGLYNPAMKGAKSAPPVLIALVYLENACEAVEGLANGQVEKKQAA